MVAAHPFDAEAPAFVERTLQDLAREIGAEALTPAFAAAFRRLPRYRFVHRYAIGGRAWYDTARGAAVPHLQRFYRDGPVLLRAETLADGRLRARAELPSPVIAARFVQLLKLRPGDRVLEIGSGSGWLLALLADIVGPRGRAVGIEIDPDLAAASRLDLAAMGIVNAEVLTGDAAVALPEGGRFNRLVISAGIDDLPRTILQAATEDAVLVAPASADGRHWRLYGWARHGNVFHAAASVRFLGPALRGRLAVADPPGPDVADLPFADLLRQPAGKRGTCFAAATGGEQRYEAMQRFGNFLTLKFARSYEWTAPGQRGGTGLRLAHYDRLSSSVAVMDGAGFSAHGGETAWQQMKAAWDEWLALGQPRAGQFVLDIHPADARPSESSSCWVHVHRDSVFVWRLR